MIYVCKDMSIVTELSELQKAVYRENSNYKVEYTSDKKDCVAVYITSNNLFFPNTPELFQKAVIEKDRYEWTRLKISRADKHIFLRDVYKQWYGSGINATLNSIDKVAEWLKDEVKGYNSLIIMGSSGGVRGCNLRNKT